MASLRDDLAARWVPSEAQIDEAEAVLADKGDAVTAHVLVNKHYGFWTEDVVVLPLPGVYADRDGASEAAQAAAKAIHEATGLPVTGGYTYHSPGGNWAVFEDILADFSDDDTIARREARRAEREAAK